jgi:hypothetical protein
MRFHINDFALEYLKDSIDLIVKLLISNGSDVNNDVGKYSGLNV